MKILAYGCVAIALSLTSVTGSAAPALLSAEQAFPIQISSTQDNEAEIRWTIPEHYYLYQHKIEVKHGQHSVPLTLPPAMQLHDDNYGKVQVYFQQLALHVPTQATTEYQVTWQGCAQDRVCYPDRKSVV